MAAPGSRQRFWIVSSCTNGLPPSCIRETLPDIRKVAFIGHSHDAQELVNPHRVLGRRQLGGPAIGAVQQCRIGRGNVLLVDSVERLSHCLLLGRRNSCDTRHVAKHKLPTMGGKGFIRQGDGWSRVEHKGLVVRLPNSLVRHNSRSDAEPGEQRFTGYGSGVRDL